jgi:hypothetical protein
MKITLKMGTLLFAETLEGLHQMMQIKSGSQSLQHNNEFPVYTQLYVEVVYFISRDLSYIHK